MTASTYEPESYLGSGKILFDVLDADGDSQGYLDLGNAQNFAITGITTEKKELKSARYGVYGQVVSSVTTKKSQSLKFTLTDINPENLALAMQGSAAAYTQSASNNTGSPESVVAHLDKWVPLSYKNLDPDHLPAVLKSATPCVKGTDYELDLVHGMIKFLSTGAIVTEGDTCTVGSTWLAINGGSLVTGDTLNKMQGRLLFLGVDQDNFRRVEVEIYRVNLTPAGDTVYLGEDFATLEFNGEIQYDSDEDGTYVVRVRDHEAA
jgi:hypothetical protein